MTPTTPTTTGTSPSGARPITLGLIVLVLIAGAVALTLAGGTGFGDLFPRGDRVEVELAGYEITPARIDVTAGEPITLVLTNTSGFAHNLAVGRDPIAEQGRIVGFGEDLLSESTVRTTPDHALVRPSDPARPMTVSVEPDASVEVELTVPDGLQGSWEFGCFQGSGCEAYVGVSATILVE